VSSNHVCITVNIGFNVFIISWLCILFTVRETAGQYEEILLPVLF